jgi:hypothetical protein
VLVIRGSGREGCPRRIIRSLVGQGRRAKESWERLRYRTATLYRTFLCHTVYSFWLTRYRTVTLYRTFLCHTVHSFWLTRYRTATFRYISCFVSYIAIAPYSNLTYCGHSDSFSRVFTAVYKWSLSTLPRTFGPENREYGRRESLC